MFPVDQMLRTMSRSHANIALWILEKDYALSYLLAGINAIKELRQGLILKGGTALRKFYFSDYRFSEDLDFSVSTSGLSVDMDTTIEAAIAVMRTMLQEHGAFHVTLERLKLRDPHPNQQEAFTVRVQFPSHRSPMCRLKVEITRDELLLMPAAPRALIHNYSDAAPQVICRCYPLEEIVAEKLRALLQSRARGANPARARA